MLAPAPEAGNVRAVTPNPPTPAAPRRRLPLRRLAIVLGIWLVAAGGALLVADALDSPVGEGARDEAQPAAPGPVELPPESGIAGAGPDGALPPLALVLDRPLPEDVSALPPTRQVERLHELVADDPTPRRLVELGSVLQLAGDDDGAREAYERALASAPGDVAARTGLAMIPQAPGAAGLESASARLSQLAGAHPRSQLVAFNQGWVEIYRRRPAPARAAWERTIALGAGTRLGTTAIALVDALEMGGSGRTP
jgi:hypothetical protein